MRVQTVVIIAGWAAWLGAIALHGMRQPKRKAVIARPLPTRIGFALQTAAAVLPWLLRGRPSPMRDVAAMVLTPASVAFGCLAVRALGKQWRVHAAIISDHELVRHGPFRVVRHPVYLSFFGMTLAGALAATNGKATALCCALFIAGTEIRIRAEERLLAGRFGEEFERFRAEVPAYLPLLR
jgi:protein-S-isoprenylcysteine O-methyltransferase Ste14